MLFRVFFCGRGVRSQKVSGTKKNTMKKQNATIFAIILRKSVDTSLLSR